MLEIKGLQEKLGVTEDQLDKLRSLRIATEMQKALLYTNIWRHGGNVHGTGDPVEKGKRRKANKLARKQRKNNV